jgi:hypothetical protein
VWRRQRRRRPACTRGRAAAAGEEPARTTSTMVEETSGVESAQRRLRGFWDKKQNDMGRATIYMFETISNGSDLKPLMMKVLSAAIQD